MLRRFMMWLGYVPTWFTAEEFEQKVGRRPCTECLRDHELFGVDPALFCDYDIDAWFDAVLA